MKRIKFKLTRFVAALLASVILMNNVCCDFVTVQATELVVGYSVLESLLLALGLNIGLGSQPGFVTQSYGDFSDLLQAWNNKSKYEIIGYGTVDFSDSESVAAYCEWASNAVNSTSVVESGYNQDVYDGLKELDKASYSNTGTSASNSIRNIISEVYGDNTASDDSSAAERYNEVCNIVFSVLYGGGGLNNGDDDDDEDNEDNDNDDDFRLKWYQKAFACLGLFGIGLISHGSAFDSLKVADETEYNDYDMSVAGENSFSWDFFKNLDSQGNYPFYFKYSYYGTVYTSKLNYGYLPGLVVEGSDIYVYKPNGYKVGSACNCDLISTNIPIFASYDDYASFAANNPLCSSLSNYDSSVDYDHTGISNYYDSSKSYDSFKSNVEGATKWFEDNGFYDWISKVQPADLSENIAPLLEAAENANGTSDALQAVSKAYTGTDTGDNSADGGTDTETGIYSNSLSSILAGILNLPFMIWSYFMNPMLAIRDSVILMLALVQDIYDIFTDVPGNIESAVNTLLDIKDLLLPVISIIPGYYRGFALGLDEIPTTLTSIWTELSDQLKTFKEAVAPDTDPYIPFISQIIDKLQSLNDSLNPDSDPDADPDPDTDPSVDPDSSDTIESDGDDEGFSGSDIPRVNGFILLIYILLMLLKIFLHLLEFIVNVFKIGADPGFITGDFATGFNYIKSVELQGMGVSVYDFLMLLVHISVIFCVVKLLRQRIDRLRI